MLDATITTTRQPIQRFKAAHHVPLSTMFATQTQAQSRTGIERDTRQVQRWNPRDSVEERYPMLLLGRPFKAGAARVGRFVCTGSTDSTTCGTGRSSICSGNAGTGTPRTPSMISSVAGGTRTPQPPALTGNLLWKHLEHFNNTAQRPAESEKPPTSSKLRSGTGTSTIFSHPRNRRSPPRPASRAPDKKRAIPPAEAELTSRHRRGKGKPPPDRRRLARPTTMALAVRGTSIHGSTWPHVHGKHVWPGPNPKEDDVEAIGSWLGHKWPAQIATDCCCCCCCCCFGHGLSETNVYVHRRCNNWHGSPRWQKTLRHRGLRKTGAQLWDNPKEREKWTKKAEKTVKSPGRHKHRHTARWNNVQISSANLRVDIRVNLHAENTKFFQKLVD